MDFISLSKSNRLFWLGRYYERVALSLQYMMNCYDAMIDTNSFEYEGYCRQQGIPNIYQDVEDFFQRYIFDMENPDSIRYAAEQMLGNGMVLRESIGSSTLAWSLNSTGTPCLVVEMGVGMRLTIEYGDKLVAGILATMVNMGMLLEKAPSVGQPIVSTDGHVGFVNANQSGIFMPVVPHGCRIHRGQTLGVIADSLTGKVREELKSPTTGLLFTLREYPVVLEGSLIARVLEV